MKKDIILISPKFSESIGGMETHSIEFVKYFSKSTQFNLKSVLVNMDVKDGILLKQPPKDSNFNTSIKRILTGDFSRDLNLILNEIKSENTILFFNSPTWLPLTKYIKIQFPNINIILRSGGNDIIAGWIGNENDNTIDLNVNRKILVSLINKYVDRLIVNSIYSKKRFLNIGIDEGLMAILKGGVDTNRFLLSDKMNNEKVRILSTGRFVKFKGFEYSLEAIKLLKDDLGDIFKYYIVGSGHEINNIKNQIKRLKLERVVKLKEALPFNEIHSIYNYSDIFLHLPIEHREFINGHSFIHTETMGRSLCEALSSGLPSIATRVGGIKEIISDNKNGFLVKEKDVVNAYELLKLLVTDTNLRNRMSLNARSFAINNYSWNKIFIEYENIFNMYHAENATLETQISV